MGCACSSREIDLSRQTYSKPPKSLPVVLLELSRQTPEKPAVIKALKDLRDEVKDQLMDDLKDTAKEQLKYLVKDEFLGVLDIFPSFSEKSSTECPQLELVSTAASALVSVVSHLTGYGLLFKAFGAVCKLAVETKKENNQRQARNLGERLRGLLDPLAGAIAKQNDSMLNRITKLFADCYAHLLAFVPSTTELNLVEYAKKYCKQVLTSEKKWAALNVRIDKLEDELNFTHAPRRRLTETERTERQRLDILDNLDYMRPRLIEWLGWKPEVVDLFIEEYIRHGKNWMRWHYLLKAAHPEIFKNY